MDRMVFAGEYVESQQIEQFLISQKIPCWINGEPHSFHRGAISFKCIPSSEVLVPPSYDDQALELINEDLNSPNDDKWICPNCKEEVDIHDALCWNCRSAKAVEFMRSVTISRSDSFFNHCSKSKGKPCKVPNSKTGFKPCK